MVANHPIQWRERTIEESEDLLWYGDRIDGVYYPQWTLLYFPVEITKTWEYDSAADFNRNAIRRNDEDDSHSKA